MAVICSAFVLDVYFDNNLAELEIIQAESQDQNTEPGKVYVISQSAPTNVKTSVQKSNDRKVKLQLHDKFLRKNYSIRKFQVLKAEVVKQTSPLISSYHYLVYQNHSFTSDEDSLS